MAEEQGPVPAVAGELAGVYRYRADEDTWWWSEEVFAIHGLDARTTVPTTKVLLDHQHPDDRGQVRSAFEDCLKHGRPFSSYHRVLTAEGKVRRVVLTGDPRPEEDGRVLVLHGFVVDVTESVNQDIRSVSDETIAAARQSQAAIDQARGMVMALYGVDADTALAILRRHSQHANTRMRDLAVSLIEAAPRPAGGRHAVRRRVEGMMHPSGPAGAPEKT